MIIKKKIKTEEKSSSTQSVQVSSGKIIKPKKKLKAIKPKVQEPEIQKVEKKSEDVVAVEPKKEEITPKSELEIKLEEYEKIDVTMPEFKERFERRRGERRRGFRRIDERTLVSRALEEAQNIREKAEKEGFDAGYKSVQDEVEKMKGTLLEFLSAKKEIYEKLTPHILEIGVEVAKKIIKKEVELSNDVLKCLIEEVFDELSSDEEKVTVKVNPEDVEFAKLSIPEIVENSNMEAKVTVVADKTVEKGSCTVIANNGVVDANFSTQLSLIQNAFGIYNGGQ